MGKPTGISQTTPPGQASLAPKATPFKAPVKAKVKISPIVKKKGANSNYYLARILEKGPENLSKAEAKELALLVRDTHRVKPVAKSKAQQGKTVFNSVTGHHEWLPTDRAEQIITSTLVWSGFYTNLRSPTWLLLVNEARYCISPAAYGTAIATAAAHALAKNGKMVPASTLGLVGHSGGLCDQGTQLTTFQSTWHDELRDIYDKHAAGNAYDAYWHELQTFIASTFLFVASPTLPVGNLDLQGLSNADVMKAIQWDLSLSGRGNPTGQPMATMFDVATYLHAEWATWRQVLQNSFTAWRHA